MTFDTGGLAFSFRMQELVGFQDLAMCGRKDGYQVQTQDSLSSNHRLLLDSPDPAIAPDPALVAAAQEINALFASKAQALLGDKRAQLVAAGHPDWAQRAEITVFLTKRGLQLGYSYAMDWKEQAPMPRKSFLRRALNPVWPKRVWKMPAAAGQPWESRYVWWPWVFWAVAALALAYAGWSLAADSLTPWSPEAAGPETNIT